MTKTEKKNPPGEVKQSTQSEGVPPPGCVRSETLMQGRTQLTIWHRGESYSLRETRNGKLILTK